MRRSSPSFASPWNNNNKDEKEAFMDDDNDNNNNNNNNNEDTPMQMYPRRREAETPSPWSSSGKSRTTTGSTTIIHSTHRQSQSPSPSSLLSSLSTPFSRPKSSSLLLSLSSSGKTASTKASTPPSSSSSDFRVQALFRDMDDDDDDDDHDNYDDDVDVDHHSSHSHFRVSSVPAAATTRMHRFHRQAAQEEDFTFLSAASSTSFQQQQPQYHPSTTTKQFRNVHHPTTTKNKLDVVVRSSSGSLRRKRAKSTPKMSLSKYNNAQHLQDDDDDDRPYYYCDSPYGSVSFGKTERRRTTSSSNSKKSLDEPPPHHHTLPNHHVSSSSSDDCPVLLEKMNMTMSHSPHDVFYNNNKHPPSARPLSRSSMRWSSSSSCCATTTTTTTTTTNNPNYTNTTTTTTRPLSPKTEVESELSLWTRLELWLFQFWLFAATAKKNNNTIRKRKGKIRSSRRQVLLQRTLLGLCLLSAILSLFYFDQLFHHNNGTNNGADAASFVLFNPHKAAHHDQIGVRGGMGRTYTDLLVRKPIPTTTTTTATTATATHPKRPFANRHQRHVAKKPRAHAATKIMSSPPLQQHYSKHGVHRVETTTSLLKFFKPGPFKQVRKVYEYHEEEDAEDKNEWTVNPIVSRTSGNSNPTNSNSGSGSGSHVHIHARMVGLGQKTSLGKIPKRGRLVEVYPAEFTDNTQLYSILDSEEDEALEQMEIRNPHPQEECVFMADWQSTFYPSCNAMHELQLSSSGGTSGQASEAESNVNLFGTKGYWRNAWRLDLWNGEFHNQNSNQNSNHDNSNHDNHNNNNWDTVVLKTLKYAHNFEDAHFEHDRVDAVAMERLTFSPHVIDIFGFCGHSVLTEYADGSRVGTLADKKRKVPLARLEIARDIALGLADVHGIEDPSGKNATFVHLDINPANVVSVGGRLKLNDFNIGILLQWNTTSSPGTQCGFPAQYPNPQWRSPEEALGFQNLTEKVDVFSMGHIFFRLVCGHEPWNKLEPGGRPSKVEINAKVQRGILPYIPPSVKDSTNQEVQAIVQAMLQCYEVDPQKRPSARQVANFLTEALEELGKKQEQEQEGM